MLKDLEYRPWIKRKVAFVVLLVIFALTVVEIWAVNRMATYGEQILKLENTKQALLLDNQVLRNKIAQRSSLNEVSKKSQYMGFDKIKKVEFLKNSGVASVN